ncbi:MAG: acetyltransferase [Acidobacteriia bacterium]|nr:acetyltransferase [Terriglobia bacterium]
MTELVILGVGPFARLMHYYFTHDSEYRVAAFTADPEYLAEPGFCGLPALPFDKAVECFPPGRARMFVAVGYRRMRARAEMFQRARTHGYELATYISSRAVRYPELRLGENNVAMANVHFEPFVTVGDNNVFWSDTLVCHDVVVGNGNYVAAKCVLGGNSVVTDGCFLGNGSILINNVTLAPETHMLPGAVALQSTRPFRKYAGNPARELDSHEERGIVIERG